MQKFKKLHIHCDGGFGNRFRALVSGLALFDKMKKIDDTTTFCIHWPENVRTMTPFSSIFEGNYELKKNNLYNFLYEDISYDYFVHGPLDYLLSFEVSMNFDDLKDKIKNSYFSDTNYYNSLNLLVNACLDSPNTNCVYSANTILPYFPTNEIHNCLKNYIVFNEKIVNQVKSFIEKNNLQNKFYGIHIRATDHDDFFTNDKKTYETYLNFVDQHKNEKIFVCSDEKSIEEEFKKYPNVCCFEKTEYPSKINKDQTYHNNILRSDISVQEAMVDLLILSKSEMLKTSGSSFLDTAELLKSANYQF